MIASGTAAAAASGLRASGAPAASSPALPEAKPESLGIDPKQLQVASDLMDKWTTGKDAPIPAGAILVGRNGKVVPPRFFGRQGPEPGAEPIRRDAMFYLASVTKPVIYMAAMRLVERGKLNLSDGGARYLPEFTGGGKDNAQVLHLFTHTSGLPDELPNNAELRQKQSPLKVFVEARSRPTGVQAGHEVQLRKLRHDPRCGDHSAAVRSVGARVRDERNHRSTVGERLGGREAAALAELDAGALLTFRERQKAHPEGVFSLWS